MGVKKPRRWLTILYVVLLLVGGWLVWKVSARPLPSSATPSQVTRRYLEDLGAGRPLAAMSMSGDYWRGRLVQNAIDPVDGTLYFGLWQRFTLSGVDVETAAEDEGDSNGETVNNYPGYAYYAFVSVDFERRYDDIASAEGFSPGDEVFDFVILGRKTRNSPWVVLDMTDFL